MLDGAGTDSDHTNRLIAHLPTVAVRAVEEVPAPAIARAGMSEVVDGAGGEQ